MPEHDRRRAESSFPSRSAKLPPHLKAQLASITPSIGSETFKYYPCSVRLKDGTEIDRVYVASEASAVPHWSDYPSTDEEIRIEDVTSLKESPSRLPANFANELYHAGESGMGYLVFTVVFRRRFGLFPCRRDFVSGTAALDFIQYPRGRGPKDVVAVLPHEGRRDAKFHPAPKYFRCLYSE